MAWLRCRWRIENAFKYLSAHHGIDALVDYHADINTDTTKIPNPARVAARKHLAAAETALAGAERALAQLLASDQHHIVINKAIPVAETRITTAHQAVAAATTQRDTHPAKLPANLIDPDATRARLRTHRRALQTPDDHRRPRPARHPPPHPRPALAPRRDQHQPARLPGDPRPITYRLTTA